MISTYAKRSIGEERYEAKVSRTVLKRGLVGDYHSYSNLTASDLLVKDSAGVAYRVGQSQECQIIASQIRVERGKPITTKVSNVVLDDEDIYTAIAGLPQEGRTYLSGTLTVFDAEYLTLPSHLDRFDTITLQPGSDIAYARLVSASPAEVVQKLGDYYASGNLIVRSIHVF